MLWAGNIFTIFHMYLVGLFIYYLCSRTVVVKVALCLSEEPIIVTKKLIYASNSTS